VPVLFTLSAGLFLKMQRLDDRRHSVSVLLVVLWAEYG
jgi:hypothetical protein